MSRYQGYSDPLEVLIDILNEMREIKEMLKPKEEIKEVTNEQPIQDTQGQQHSTTSRKRNMDKSVGKRGAVQPHKRASQV